MASRLLQSSLVRRLIKHPSRTFQCLELPQLQVVDSFATTIGRCFHVAATEPHASSQERPPASGAQDHAGTPGSPGGAATPEGSSGSPDGTAGASGTGADETSSTSAGNSGPQSDSSEGAGSQSAEGSAGSGFPGGGAGAWWANAAGWRANVPPVGDVGGRVRSTAMLIWREVAAAVMPEAPVTSATRAHAAELKPSQGAPTSSAVTVVVPKESRWQKQWTEWQGKLGLHPLFQRLQGLRDAKVFHKGGEVAEALRERWETSDSPVVHRIQDMTENMFAETEMAQALREIRARDPAFDMPKFLTLLKNDVPRVIRAYLENDGPVLKEHCSPEMVERLTGIMTAQHAEGLYSDLNILDVSEVELVDLKYVDGHPILVVQFTCQQINCTRDKFGNVVEGGPDQVQRNYYYWALQQDPSGFVGTDGRLYAPRWQLREMMLRGMHNLL